jgi:hypothetical protein
MKASTVTRRVWRWLAGLLFFAIPRIGTYIPSKTEFFAEISKPFIH